jgi:hypothetical protein
LTLETPPRASRIDYHSELHVAENRDSARKGKAVEHLVAATGILVSGLELNVSTSLVDDEGVDLVFHRRERSTTLAVQVKSRSMSANTIAKNARFIANVGASTFRPRGDLFVLFVAVNTDDGTFDPVWLVPSEVLARRTTPNSQNRHVFSASMKPKTNDQWREFRLARAELPERILSLLDDLGSVAA